MNQRPRIAMVAYTIYRPDARVRRHVSALRSAGFDVDVYALLGSDGVRDRDEEGLRFLLPRRRASRQTGKLGVFKDYLAFTAACKYLLLRNHLGGPGYALVHINNMPNFLIAAALPLKVMGVPLILDIHDTMPEIYQDKFGVDEGNWMIRALLLEERLSLSPADFVLTTEHTKWERLLTNGLNQSRSCVTLNLPDTRLFPTTSLVGEQPGPEDEFRLVYHGTLARRLGMDIAVRAVAALRERIPRLRLDIIGDGEQRADLVTLVQELSLGEHVRFSDGFVPIEELTARLRGAHLAVIPSRSGIGTSLMLPTKLLEYVQLGIPAVTVATPTILRYFDSTMVDFARSEDPQDLAEHIWALYCDPGRRQGLAIGARTFYERYDFVSERRKYLDVVEALVRRERPPSAEIH